jgi:hypothetical protein
MRNRAIEREREDAREKWRERKGAKEVRMEKATSFQNSKLESFGEETIYS